MPLPSYDYHIDPPSPQCLYRPGRITTSIRPFRESSVKTEANCRSDSSGLPLPVLARTGAFAPAARFRNGTRLRSAG